MTYRTQTSRLMHRLGFVADPPSKPQVVSSKEAAYWRHQPTGACVMVLHKQRYTEAQIVRAAISAAIYQTLRGVGDGVGSVVRNARSAHEEQAYAFGQRGKP